MENAIGTKLTLEVVEGNGCDDCFFFAVDCCEGVRCDLDSRSDHKSIIYKEIKED